MINIQVKDTDGTVRKLEVESNPGNSLMELLVENEFDVPALCGGLASCGTCHVSFEKGFNKLREKEDNEIFMLDSLPNSEANSRLSCQCPVDERLDGAEIAVVPE